MRIWFIEIGEPLPLEEGKRLLRYGRFTQWLAARGHDVTWWSCNFSHAMKKHVVSPGDYLLDSGVKMHVLPGVGYKSNVSIGRFYHHGQYAKRLKAALDEHAATNQPLPDIIFCPIPTVENAKVISDFAENHNIPYIIDVRDHWPQDFVDRFPKLLRPLARLGFSRLFDAAHKAAKGATMMTGVTKKQMAYGLNLANRSENPAYDKVFYIGYTRAEIPESAHTDATTWWYKNGLKKDSKIFSFIGTIGVSFDFDPVLKAAKKLRDMGRDDIQFVLAGDGGARAKLIGQSGDNVLTPGWIDQAKIDALLKTSTAALAPYIPGTSMSLPNKYFEYMAYGLPVLSSCSGESEELIKEKNIGIHYDVNDDDGFLQAVLDIADASEITKLMGQTSEDLFKTQFDQGKLFADIESHLLTLLNMDQKSHAA